MNGTDILVRTKILNGSVTEVMNISPFGFWLLTGAREYFIDFESYPVFENASILDIATVESDAFGNLHWPKLDADIEIKALENPEEYPLVDKTALRLKELRH